MPDYPVALDLRDRIVSDLGPEEDILPKIVAALPLEKLTGHVESVYSSKVLMELLDGGLANLAARREEEAINYLLPRVCARELSLAELG